MGQMELCCIRWLLLIPCSGKTSAFSSSNSRSQGPLLGFPQTQCCEKQNAPLPASLPSRGGLGRCLASEVQTKKRAQWLLGDLVLPRNWYAWHRPFLSVWLEAWSTHLAAVSTVSGWQTEATWALVVVEGQSDRASWMTTPAAASLGSCHLGDMKLYCFRLC